MRLPRLLVRPLRLLVKLPRPLVRRLARLPLARLMPLLVPPMQLRARLMPLPAPPMRPVLLLLPSSLLLSSKLERHTRRAVSKAF